ncbi:MAG: hypothetical protein IT239_01675 [Bacteroidia bacterium]|nr:hypothetical protein [Bacteroidia bacterium]
MDSCFHATADFFEALFPMFKSISHLMNGFWIVGIFLGVSGWVTYLLKNKDAAENLD